MGFGFTFWDTEVNEEMDGYLKTNFSWGFTVTFNIPKIDLNKIIENKSQSKLKSFFNSYTRNDFFCLIYNKQSNIVTVVNDHFGSNEIFYAVNDKQQVIVTDNIFYLKKEIENLTIDNIRINEYFAFGCIQPPSSIFTGVSTVPAGHILTIQITPKKINCDEYWNPEIELHKNIFDYPKLKKNIQESLFSSAKQELDFSNHYGVSLSGGVDSGGLLSVLTKATSIKTTAFTVGPYGPTSGDLPSARKSASFNNAHHIEIYPSAKDLQKLKSYMSRLNQPLDGNPVMVNGPIFDEAEKHEVHRMLFGFGTDNMLGCQKYSRMAYMLEKISFLPKVLQNLIIDSYILVKKLSTDQKNILKAKDNPSRFLAVKSIHYWSFKKYLKEQNDPLTTTDTTGLQNIFTKNSPLSLVEQYIYADWKFFHIYNRHGLINKLARPRGISIYDPAYTPIGGISLLHIPDKYRKLGNWDKQIFRDAVKPFSPPHLYDNQRKSCILEIKKWFEDEKIRRAYQTKIESSPFARKIFDTKSFFEEYKSLPAPELVLLKLLAITLWYEAHFAESNT